MDFGFLYGSAKGRISRKTWWLGAIGLIILIFIVQLVLSALFGVLNLNGTTFGLGLQSLVVLAIFFAPYYALTIKRLHDRSRPTALFWVFFAPSVVNALLTMMGVTGGMRTIEIFGTTAPAFQPNALGGAVSLIVFCVGLWALVELGFLKGDAGANAYGPDPLGGRKAPPPGDQF